MAEAAGAPAAAGATVSLAGGAGQTLLGTPVEASIMEFFDMFEAAGLRSVCKQVKAATAGCTFAKQWDSIKSAGSENVDGRHIDLFRRCFPRAEAVKVRAEDMTDADAAHLRGLRRVYLAFDRGGLLTDEGLRALASPALRELHLHESQLIKGDGFAALQGLETLSLLDLRDLDPARLRLPSSLRTVHMERCYTVEDSGNLDAAAFLTGLPLLEGLRLEDMFLQEDEAAGVLDLPNLQRLHMAINGSYRFSAFDWARFPALQSLTLSELGDEENAEMPLLHPFTLLPAGLAKVSLIGFPTRDEDIAHLTALEELTVSWSPLFTGSCLDRYPQLRQFWSWACPELQHVRFAAGAPVEKLTLRRCPSIKASSFANVASVRSLELLVMPGLNEADLLLFPNLEALRAHSCAHFHGPGMALFARLCPTLRSVQLQWSTANDCPMPPQHCIDSSVAALQDSGFSHAPDHAGPFVLIEMSRSTAGAQGAAGEP